MLQGCRWSFCNKTTGCLVWRPVKSVPSTTGKRCSVRSFKAQGPPACCGLPAWFRTNKYYNPSYGNHDQSIWQSIFYGNLMWWDVLRCLEMSWHVFSLSRTSNEKCRKSPQTRPRWAQGSGCRFLLKTIHFLVKVNVRYDNASKLGCPIFLKINQFWDKPIDQSTLVFPCGDWCIQTDHYLYAPVESVSTWWRPSRGFIRHLLPVGLVAGAYETGFFWGSHGPAWGSLHERAPWLVTKHNPLGNWFEILHQQNPSDIPS